ncbi:MAG: hypothetical protein WBD13_12825 [Burkholderiaceae bacterium]
MNALWRSVWSYIVATKLSSLAFLITGTLGLLSMGVLGGVLYYAVFLALPASYPNINNVNGDWVWPAVIMVGMAWSLGFLQAGALNLKLKRKGVAIAWRRIAYVIVLWLWALLLWLVGLAGR